jgi:hypothetical protein
MRISAIDIGPLSAVGADGGVLAPQPPRRAASATGRKVLVGAFITRITCFRSG